MGNRAEYDDDELYNAWVVCNRNAAAAGRKLGMTAVAMQAHVRRKDFEKRYSAEFSGTAEGVRRMVLTDMLLQLPRIAEALMTIIEDDRTDGDGKPVTSSGEKVRAIDTYFKYLPALPREEPEKMSYIDAKSFSVPPGSAGTPLSAEEQVRLALEENIIAAGEERSRRKN